MTIQTNKKNNNWNVICDTSSNVLNLRSWLTQKSKINAKVLFSAFVDIENDFGSVSSFQIVGEDESNIKINKIAYTLTACKSFNRK